ncbi:MAG: alcohol dehydrogenase catalytic domain-containing protein [Planctomycetes bacterium]|nr:alcohol dehydrogenase catalytic domain-containing protein [Planctomycetota bacterium]
MRGLLLDAGRLTFSADLPEPRLDEGSTTVRVVRAGICATDLALARGYMGFRGIPGHEFVGVALDGPLCGKRVVGEINAACGACPACRAGLGRHCPQRTVLGILAHGGAFAERLRLPTENLHAVPDTIGDDAATFTEPTAAAFEIVEQLAPAPGTSCLVVGDGKLGLLCAQVLAAHGTDVTLAGRHPDRCALIPQPVAFLERAFEAGSSPPTRRFALIVEATGNPEVLPRLFAVVEPRGTIVLKTTTERPTQLDLAPLVVDEVSLVGSRCGPFGPALDALANGRVEVEPMIEARYGLEEGSEAFEHAARPGALKVLLEP